MSVIEDKHNWIPSGVHKLLYINWALIILIFSVASIGFIMLYSVAGGNINPWAQRQMIVFSAGMLVMLFVGLINIKFWRKMSPYFYIISLILLIVVELFGHTGMGAQRWINLGPIKLQPSELMKVALIMVLAQYYHWLDKDKVSKPLWVLLPLVLTALPMALVLKQPDLGTAILLMTGAAVIMFLAGVSMWYFFGAFSVGVALIATVMKTRGTEYQILKNYQYKRIDTFLDPSLDPSGSGYHITQSKIALGSGGMQGRGFMKGTQSQLNFLPEKHTDFIFTTFAEEFGLYGSFILLTLYGLIILFCIASALQNKNQFGALITLGMAATFFFFFSVNIAMVTGLAPVVGVPLPLVSYGGSAMLVLLFAFGLVQSAHIHRPRHIE